MSSLNEHGKPKFVGRADLLSTIHNSKLIMQSLTETRDISHVESFCIESTVAAFNAAIYEIEVFKFLVLRRL